MNLETVHGFQHITDVLSGNAIATMIFFSLAIVALKLIVTLATAMVRDDARNMELYRRNVEGRSSPQVGETPEDAAS